MNLYLKIFLLYFAIINLISIIITVYDKIKAVNHGWRVPEKTLLLFAALGGSVSMYITMQLIRHKTQKFKFVFGIPLIFVIQISLFIFIWCFCYGK